MQKSKLALIIDTVLKLSVAVVLIIAATTKQQYNFYIYLRWGVFIGFLFFSYRSYLKKEIGLIFLFLGVAVIFNPTQKFLFQKQTWHLIDYLLAGVLLITIFYDWFHNILSSNNNFTNMNDKTLIKKRIAREVLFFFGAIVLVGLVWMFLFLRNAYFDSRQKNLEEQITSLTVELDTLPNDKIKAIYDGLCNNFVVNYEADSFSFRIPKRNEEAFLKEYPYAKQMNNYPNGYSYMPSFSITLKDGEVVNYGDKSELVDIIRKKYPEYSEISDKELGQRILKKYLQHSDSTIVFDFVDLETFRNLIKSKDYRDKFYEIFKWQKYVRIDDSEGDEHPVYKKHTAYDLGTKEDFESNVQLGLKYDKTAIDSRNTIEEKIKSNRESVKDVALSIWDSERIKWFLLATILVIAVVLYPLRLTYLLIQWAIKTVR